MRTFHCNRCEQLVFFENVRCERCEALLGYLPELGGLSAFEEAGDELWRSLHPKAEGALYRQCHNYSVENVCNWMIPADQPETLCRSCQLTRTIPNLTAPDNRLYWYRLEVAKRRLLYTLAALGVKVESRRENPQTGLEFEFLEETSAGEKVLTGHDNGLITLNIAEADDAYRERTRTAMHEPYRTLLGHFRHETGHYFFDRLVVGTPWLEPYRALFGDESVDYAEALDTYYRNGTPADWSKWGTLLRLVETGRSRSVVLLDPKTEAINGVATDELTLEGVYEALLTSAPMHASGGIGSPANALALK